MKPNLPYRILHVVSSMDRAGQETLIMNLYRDVNKNQIQFDFLCTDPKKGDFDDEINSLGGRIFHLTRTNMKIPHLRTLEYVYKYKDFFSNHPEYQIVHFHNYHAYSALIQIIGAKLGNVRDIIVHSHNTSAPHSKIHKIFRPVLNLYNIQRFACSNEAGKWMYGNKKFTVIKNGIDFSQFKYNEKDRKRVREQLMIDEFENVVCHIGRFNYQKNHKRLITIFKEILILQPKSTLLLVGQGELRNEIMSEINRLELSNKIRFLGSRNDIPAILSASDVFLFPSLFEGLSVVLIEAQANGIPIVCSDINTDEGLFTNNICKLPLKLDDKFWASKVLEYSKLGHSINNEGLDNTSGFNIKSSTKNLTTLYLNLMTKNKF